MMKFVYWFAGILVGVLVLLAVVPIVVSELGGEVVTLHRSEESSEKGGASSRIRVWVVDNDDASWIEHGDTGSYWMTQLQAANEVVLERKGLTNTYEGVLDPASHGLYHTLRRQKYGWADQFIELFSGASADCEGVPVRLRLMAGD
jgi:hypothetical protein